MKRVAFAHAVKILFMIRSVIEQPYMAFKFFNFFKKKEVQIRISIHLSSLLYAFSIIKRIFFHFHMLSIQISIKHGRKENVLWEQSSQRRIAVNWLLEMLD